MNERRPKRLMLTPNDPQPFLNGTVHKMRSNGVPVGGAILECRNDIRNQRAKKSPICSVHLVGLIQKILRCPGDNFVVASSSRTTSFLDRAFLACFPMHALLAIIEVSGGDPPNVALADH